MPVRLNFQLYGVFGLVNLDNAYGYLQIARTLIVLHPNYRSRYKILPSLLANQAFLPVYLIIPERATTWEQLWRLLGQALREQTTLNLCEMPENSSPEAAARHLCRALQRPHLIVLDAADNLEQGSCSPFFAALAQDLPQHSKAILIGRAWLADLIARLPNKTLVRCYPTSEPAMLFDYRTASSGSKLLEVYAHADGRVLVNGVEVRGWEGYLPRALFYFFVDRGIATREEIFESFWGELDRREATNVFHVTKRKVHEILGFSLTVYQSGYYRIAPNIELHYDVAMFLDRIQRGDLAEPEEAVALLESAVKLYRKDFLRGLNGGWIAIRRADLRNQLADALGTLGRLYSRAERHMQAINAYERALSIQPYREDWAYNLMNLYAMQRQAVRGLAVFERLERALVRQLGRAKLDKRTQELVAKLRRM